MNNTNTVTYFDTHCHLFSPPLDSDLPGVVQRALEAGVAQLVVPGADLDSSEKAVRIASEYDGVYPAVGVHPHATGDGEVDLDALDRLIRSGHVVAVGEIGLDTSRGKQDLAFQEKALRSQLSLARDHGLPVIIHCRGAFGRILEILKAFGPGGPGGVFHAFAGSIEVAEGLGRLGYLTGVGGAATRRHASRLRKTVAALPTTSIVAETDAPFIGSEHHPPGTMEPAYLPEILAAISELKGMPLDEVASITTANALSLFPS